MKIAMIGHKRIPSREGGIEIVVGELASRMAAEGHTVTAYNRKSRHIAGNDFSEKRRREWNGVRLKWVYTPDSAKLNAIVYSFFAALRAVFRRYDVLHFHAEGPSAMVPLAKLFGKKCVVTVHGLDWQRAKWGGFATRFLKFGEKCAAGYADAVIVLSRNVQQYFLDTYQRDTVFIPNGISLPAPVAEDILCDRYALEKDSYLLFLGRLVPEKGVHYLINAYKSIQTDKLLVIAGGASHTGEYERELRALAEDDERIRFTGFVQGEALEALYAGAYIYILPSDLEGMPISLLEAMSYGNCCLISDIPECTEVCGEHAAVFHQGDEQDLARVLTALLQDEARVKALKNGAADYICDRYSWEEVTQKTLALYQAIRGKQ